jgi:hypothetical protein
MNRKDFKVSVGPKGYVIAYRGKIIAYSHRKPTITGYKGQVKHKTRMKLKRRAETIIDGILDRSDLIPRWMYNRIKVIAICGAD